MTFDEYGTLWLSDPWIALTAVLAIVGIVLWSHGWIVTGKAPRPRTVTSRIRRDAVTGLTLAQLRLAQHQLTAADAQPTTRVAHSKTPTMLHAVRQRSRRLGTTIGARQVSRSLALG